MPHDIHESVGLRLWRQSIALALLLFVYSLSYALLYVGTFSLVPLATAFAMTGGLLIGLSFALSGICFYTNIIDSAIMYRKYFGILGWCFALLYSVMLVFLYPDLYGYGLFTRLGTPEVWLGLTAMGILTVMTLVSNTAMMRHLGGSRWKFIMHLGYGAYALLIARAVLLEGSSWLRWLEALRGLPPPRLLLSIYAAAVIALRISIPLTKWRRNRARLGS